MDTPTHGLIGRLVARSIWPEKSDTGLVNVVTICSVLPDLDVLLPGGGLDGLVTHRGISHSVFGTALGAMAVAWIVQRMILNDRSFGQVYVAAFFGMLIHIFFDVVTTYGTLIFAPFSDYRVAIDTLFIIDPYLDLMLIAGLLLGWLYKQVMYRWATWVLVGYVVFCALVTGVGHFQVRSWAAYNDVVIDRLAVMPTPFSPLHRRSMVVSGSKVFLVSVSLFRGADGYVEEFVEARSDRRLKALWNSPSGAIYGWFVRFPIVQEIDGNQNFLMVQDLQFMPRPTGLGWLGSWVAGLALDHGIGVFERRIFALEIELDQADQIVKMIYLGQNGERYPL